MFNYLGRFDQVISDESLFGSASESIGPSTDGRGQRAYLLEINAAVGDGRLQIGWNYSDNLFDRATVQAMADMFIEALRSLIVHCRAVERPRFTPSDFSLVDLDQGQLDELMAAMPALEDVYPMSQVQQGMLFHDLSEPGAGVYISQSAARLRGLDAAAFHQAWARVTARHSVLRTAFVHDRLDEPLQAVAGEVELPWREEDCRGLDAEAVGRRVSEVKSEDRLRPFDYASAPLMRFSLLRCEDDAHHFVWTHHLLLLDGWSASALVREVFEVYWSLIEGSAIELPAQRPYRDYIAWLQRQDPTESEEFWRGLLDGIEGPTAFGIDRSSSDTADDAGERYADRFLQLSAETTTALQDFARRDRLTLSTIVHGVWALLLSRYSGDRDVVFGSTVSGRPSDLAGVESMLGVFINTLPVRISVAGDSRADAWLRELQGRLTDMRQYEHTPLVDVQRWSDVPRSSTLFDSIVVFENYPVDESVAEHSRELTVEDSDLYETTNYPLTVIAAGGKQLSLRIYYDTQLFDGGAVERMLKHAATLIEGLVSSPGEPLSGLSTLGAEEAAALLDRGQGPRLVPEDRCLPELVAERAENTPEAIAVECGDDRLTYAELRRLSGVVARQLRRRGAAPGSLVGISVQRSASMLPVLLGILEAGAAYVPLDPAYPAERIGFIIEDAGIELLVTEPSVVEGLPDACPTLLVDDLLQERDDEVRTTLPAVQPGDLAYVIFTSGSTGKPKGVQIEHGALVNFLRSMAASPGMTADDVLVAVTTISFDIAGLELYLPLLVGGRVVIAADGVEADGRQLAGLLERSGATVFQATPATYRLLIETGWDGRSRLKALCGGETLPRDLAEDLVPRCHELWNMYGPTETTIWSLVGKVCSGEGAVPIGEPIANTDLVLLDPQGQLAAVGVPARLHLGGSGLARGYWRRPELTSEKFGTFRVAGDEERRLYDTGDLARWTADGELEFLGRVDHQVKVRGFRIELGEIEACLSDHPAVQACGVVVTATSSGDKRLAGYVVLKPRASETVTQLRRHLGESLPDYMVPPTMVVLDDLPLTPNGKLDRRALSDLGAGGAAVGADAHHPPTTPLEQAVAEIWERVLEVERVGRYDNFFDLGGHSLLAMRVTFQAEKALGIDVLPMELLVQNLAQFAEMCGKRGARVGEEAAPEPATSSASWMSRLRRRLKRRE